MPRALDARAAFSQPPASLQEVERPRKIVLVS